MDQNFLASLGQLKSLTLIEADPAALDESFFRTLSGLPQLTGLFLTYNIDDEVLAALQPMPTLQKLSMTSKSVSAAALAATVTSKLPGLTELLFAYSDVSDADADSLKTLKQLKRLDVTGNRLSSSALDSLRQALPQCQILSDYGTFEPAAAIAQ